MSTTPERTTLRQAIEAHATAEEEVAQCEETLQKANALLESLEEQAVEYESLDSDIASARAQQMKLALASGEAHHSLLNDDVEGFAAKRIARDSVTSHLERVRETIPVLETELQQAEADEKRCDLEREWAAAAVLAQEADAIATEFNEKLIDLRRMSYLLHNLAFKQVRRAANENVVPSIPGHLYGSGPYRRITMPPAVNQAVQENILGLHEQHYGFGMRANAAHAVSVFWNELQADAEASLTDEPPEEQSEAAE